MVVGTALQSRILQGRDARSVWVLVPDCRGLDQNFHDVTVVDMGDLPESQVSIPELSELARRWPPAVITHMRWRQPELEELKNGGQGAIPEETAGGVRVLWHHNQVRYVAGMWHAATWSWLSCGGARFLAPGGDEIARVDDF